MPVFELSPLISTWRVWIVSPQRRQTPVLPLKLKHLDVRREVDVNRALVDIVGRHGCTDVLVNCAGGAESLGPLVSTSSEDWQANIELNLTSQFLCIRAVLPIMTKQQNGSIINIASNSVASGLTAAHFSGRRAPGTLLPTLRPRAASSP